MTSAARRPVVGIITNLDAAADYMFPGYARITINEDYPRSVAAAGGVPFLMAPSPDHSMLPEQLSVLDGLILAGGADINPQLYGQDPLAKCGELSPVRDAYEMEALRLAQEAGLPVFCICRGMQLANAYFGGTLFQDLSYAGLEQQHMFAGNPTLGVHAIEIEPGTFLAEAAASSLPAQEDGSPARRAMVNSYHHQVVDRLGEGLRVCARTHDGAIEAVEYTGEDMRLAAVQWHPEMMTHEDPLAQGLFREFVASLG